MQKALQLFNQTFNRIPQINNYLDILRKTLPKQNLPYYLNQTAAMFYLSKRLTQDISQLQNSDVLNIIDYFDRKFNHFQYNYDDWTFLLNKKNPQNQAKCILRSLDVQNFDHPFTRQSLYLHELKDVHKFIEMQQNKSHPKFWKQMQLQMAKKRVLNKQNPLGVPTQSQAVLINFQFSNKQKMCGFDVQCILGQIILKKAYNYQNDQKVTFDCYVLEQKTQNTFFQYIEQQTKLNAQDYEQLNSLAFVGGRVRSAQFMFNYLQQLTLGIEQQSNNPIKINMNPYQNLLPKKPQPQPKQDYQDSEFDQQQFSKLFKQVNIEDKVHKSQ